MPLAALFDVCFRRCQTHEDAPSAASMVTVERLIAALGWCNNLIESNGIFSSNEDQDDLSTSAIRYLLVPYMLAGVNASTSVKDKAQRLRHVQNALDQYGAFLQRCQQYDTLGAVGKSQFHLQEDGLVPDATSQRVTKIETYKRKKAIDMALDALTKQQRRGNYAERDSEEATTLGGPSLLDEEDERQLWLLKLEQAALDSLQQRQLLRQEVDLLRHALTRQPGGGHGSSTGPSVADMAHDAEQKARMAAQLRRIVNELDVGERQRMKDQVFRPSHTMPTLTVEQQGMIEYEQLMQRQKAEQQANATAKERDAAAGSDDEYDDARVYEQRAKDDYNDANPRGWGNSKLRPCA